MDTAISPFSGCDDSFHTTPQLLQAFHHLQVVAEDEHVGVYATFLLMLCRT
jgi:hypothetical protein